MTATQEDRVERGQAPTDEPMIRLEELTKSFPGQDEPAVDSLTLEVPEGEIVILVGPSGCGKTTTLEMMNRLVEPTSGRIYLEGDDVTDGNPDELRRRMGYAIQQIGLFPHRTISDNIATVPNLLGWDSDRIAERVDELLELVGLPPDRYRDRYPKEMSGGQRQRVGVARAMAADPPVMLMDEPFGATDPITRERLQNEFLRIQEEIRKTIVFVTHDIDEALKMGDRIAILATGSKIAQYDTPERILAAPANDFVEDFLGSGRILKRLDLGTVSEVDLSSRYPTARPDASHEELRAALQSANTNWLLLVDENRRPQHWISREEAEDGEGRLEELGARIDTTVNANERLSDALQSMLLADSGVAVVVDDDDRYLGTVDLATLNQSLRRMRSEATSPASDTSANGNANGASS